MRRIETTFNRIEPHAGERGFWLPSALPAAPLARAQWMIAPTLDDLREIAKEDEVPNIDGLAVYPIRRPWAGPAGRPESPPNAPDALAPWLEQVGAREPLLVVEGAMGGESPHAMAVTALVPRGAARVATVLRMLLWPAADDPPAPELTLLWLPEVLGAVPSVVAWELQPPGGAPPARLAAVLGTDDPAAALHALLRAARARWPAEQRTGQWRLPDAEDAAQPWQLEEDPAVAAFDPRAREGVATPLWANPPVPAQRLALADARRPAARALATVHWGVEVDAQGRLPLFHGRTPAPERFAGLTPPWALGWTIPPRIAVVGLW